MSGLLQRLASQALGARADRSGTSIRASASPYPLLSTAPAAEVSTLAPEATMTISGRRSADGTDDVPRAPAVRATSEPEVEARATASAFPLELNAAQTTHVSAPHAQRNRSNDPAAPARADDPAAVLPTPLLPETAHAPAPPAIMPARVETRHSTPTVNTADLEQHAEIHVHIGRIEVTGANDPPPVKASRARARQAVPLSDYLARKRL